MSIFDSRGESSPNNHFDQCIQAIFENPDLNSGYELPSIDTYPRFATKSELYRISLQTIKELDPFMTIQSMSAGTNSSLTISNGSYEWCMRVTEETKEFNFRCLTTNRSPEIEPRQWPERFGDGVRSLENAIAHVRVWQREGLYNENPTRAAQDAMVLARLVFDSDWQSF